MKRWLGALGGACLFSAILAADLPVGPEAARLAAVAALVVVFWITEALPLPVTALLGSALCILLGVARPQEVLAPYADPIIFLFLGVFLLGEAVVSTGIDARFGRAVTGLSAVRSSPRLLVPVLCLSAAFLSMWMSNTAAAAVLMPLALSTLRPGSTPEDSRFGSRLVLAVAYGASFGGVATPIGTPPNLIAIGFLENATGTHIDFVSWMKLGVPLALVLVAGLAGLLLIGARRFRGAGSSCSPGLGPGMLPATHARGCASVSAEREPWNCGQVAVVAVFGLMVAAWLLPSILPALVPPASARHVASRVPECLVALLGATLLFVLPRSTAPLRPILEWKHAVRVDWGTILLFGGGLSLGSLVLKTGLGAWLGNSLLQVTGASSALGLVALSAASATVLTEFMSNTAAANVVIPVVFAMSTSLGVSPTPPVLAAALGASMAFMLPVSTPPNAIAYATGKVTIPRMLAAGILLDLLGFVSIVLACGVFLG